MRKIRFLNAFLCVILIILLLFTLMSCCDAKEPPHPNDFTEKSESTEEQSKLEDNDKSKIETFVLNIKSQKIHKTTCGTGDLILPENRKTYKGDIADLLEDGYTKCGNCFRGEQ
ncbi:MAG: hypothetical protein IJ345_05670 [Clostridia bacterium]|nr:hypothetical protein [Clostridia bacterium]